MFFFTCRTEQFATFRGCPGRPWRATFLFAAYSPDVCCCASRCTGTMRRATSPQGGSAKSKPSVLVGIISHHCLAERLVPISRTDDLVVLRSSASRCSACSCISSDLTEGLVHRLLPRGRS